MLIYKKINLKLIGASELGGAHEGIDIILKYI